MAMERNHLLLMLLITGIIVSTIGFALAQYLLALAIVSLIVIAFLYSDFLESNKSGRKDLKKNATLAVFVFLTFYCMITGWWILWAGITAMLYVDAMADSTRDWLDARQLRYLDAMKEMKLPESPQPGENMGD
jgi:hypothetical protein